MITGRKIKDSSFNIRTDKEFREKLNKLSKHYKIKEWASIIRNLIDNEIKTLKIK